MWSEWIELTVVRRPTSHSVGCFLVLNIKIKVCQRYCKKTAPGHVNGGNHRENVPEVIGNPLIIVLGAQGCWQSSDKFE
jgi:hypothetical protein